MVVLDLIPKMDAAALATLRGNAERWTRSGTDKQKHEAETVLLAITVEERRRKDEESRGWHRQRVEIEQRVRDWGLHDRVVVAFTERPPAAWEVDVLQAIARNPDRDFDTLAKSINKRSGSYINLAVGSLCSAREPWLGTAPPANDGSAPKVYSALLIDFTRHVTASGAVWHGWTLKPGAETGLRQVGVL